jgi:hypothetical protein
MSEMTPEEFWAIWENSAPAPSPEIEYRLYYDDNGFPLFYSMEDSPGMYIRVDKDTFFNGPKHIRVIDGKIVETQICWTKKLIPAPLGVSCHPQDVCIIVDPEQPHTNWRLKHEEPKYDQPN